MSTPKSSIEISRTGNSEEHNDEIVPLELDDFSGTFREPEQHHAPKGWFYFEQSDSHRGSARFLVSGALVCLCLIFILLPILFNINYYQPDDSHTDWGQVYHENIDLTQIEENMRFYSAEAHIAGSPRDFVLANRTAELFAEYGFKSQIIEQIVLLPNPVYDEGAYRVALTGGPAALNEMYGDYPIEAKLKEAVVPEDPTSANEAPPVFNGWSANGTVEDRQLVYANYGREEDYLALEAAGVNFTGKIVIVRYGKIFRGNKANFAEQRGAAGVLIYSDPEDIVKGPVYPEGPWKPASSVQRGSVWLGDGDPSTPQWASTPEAPHLTYEEALDPAMTLDTPLPKILVQPLSYEDAEPLMRALALTSTLRADQGDFDTLGFQGELGTTEGTAGAFVYGIEGDNTTTVTLTVSTDIRLTPIWTVVGEIEGNKFPNRQVLIGAHRDAWTMGAADPVSGTSTLLNVAQTFGKLLKEGWKPDRTIVLCSWDAEEMGLIGSIEYGQQFSNILSSQAVAYINIDIAVSGNESFSAAGTPQMNEYASKIFDLVDNGEGVPVSNDWEDNKLQKLGSGSDQVVFIHHLGIPSFDLTYGNRSESYQSVYHSNYDSFYWMSNFGDPGFVYHGIMSEIVGRLAIELVGAEILPFNYIDYARELRSYITQLEAAAPSINFEPLSRAVDVFEDAATKTFQDIEKLKESQDQLREEERDLIDRTGLTQETNDALRAEEARLEIEFEALNDRLILTERAMINTFGLPGRPFYRHIVFAPSAKNSYEGSGFPSIADAISDNNLKLAEDQMLIATQLIITAAETLDGSS